MALILLTIGLRNLPFLAGMALLPIELALFEWYRKSELSSDRAGLLSGQDPPAAMMAELKMAGGKPRGIGPDGLVIEEDDEINLDEFLAQAEEYETGGTAIDSVFKFLNVAFQTHPFHTVRAAELHRWVRSGDYYRILDGDYPRRGSEPERPLRQDYAEAGSYYEQQARQAMDQVGDVLVRAKDAFTEALRGRPK
jgi:hypothetical protein